MRSSRRAVAKIHGRYMGLDDAMGVEADQVGVNSQFLEIGGYGEAHGDPGTLLDAGTMAAWRLHASLLGSGGSHCWDGCRHPNSCCGGLPVASSYCTSAALLDILDFAVSHLEMGNGCHETRHSCLHNEKRHRDAALELVE
jgi:hypothetical protein